MAGLTIDHFNNQVPRAEAGLRLRPQMTVMMTRCARGSKQVLTMLRCKFWHRLCRVRSSLVLSWTSPRMSARAEASTNRPSFSSNLGTPITNLTCAGVGGTGLEVSCRKTQRCPDVSTRVLLSALTKHLPLFCRRACATWCVCVDTNMYRVCVCVCVCVRASVRGCMRV